jgi:membrane protein DedA with SNARE-associated domain
METFTQLIQLLEPYGSFSLLIIFLVLVACGFGFPLPEDIPLMAAGFLAGQDIIHYGLTNVVCMLGVLVGDSIIFTLGLKLGPRIKKISFIKRILTDEREEKIHNWFHKYGVKTIFFARFAPGLRMPLFLSAGLYKVPFWKFFALDGFAALISVPLWIWLAYTFSSNLELLMERAKTLQMGIFAILGSLLVLIITVIIVQKKKAKAAKSS